VFFSTVVLYLYVGAEFLAFLFLIVYVGAIAILFLFVIMLLQLKIIPSTQLYFSSPRAKVMAVSAPFAVLGLSDVLTTELSTFFSISDTIVFQTVAKTTAELV
jgi:NADH:ubiquinone oxidoreductase subunit 6 (subunit J)